MVKYITGDELAEILKGDQVPHEDYLVVDVRDDDWVGGNVKGSHHVPSGEFHSKVDELVAETKDVPIVIFHCTFSQERGPRAARIYQEIRNNLQVEGEDSTHEVCILRDGFAQFQSKFKDDPLLVENWDKDVWALEF